MGMVQPNPYLTPAGLDVEGDGLPWQATWLRCWPVLLLGPLAGAVIGGATNAVNGWVGPAYYTWVVGWQDYIWVRAIGEGMLEGGVYGFGNAVFLLVAALTLFRAADFTRIAQAALLAALLALLLWTLGGMAAQVVLAIAPDWFFALEHPWRPGPPPASFAWVVGSIQAIIFGSPLATLGAVLWLRQQFLTSNDEPKPPAQ
jgi:hypothetical protein